MALSLIDRLGLYNTVFLNPKVDHNDKADTEHWSLAYGQLSDIAWAPAEKDGTSTSLALIKEILLPDSEHVYLAWLLCAFVPWARAVPAAPENPKSKAPLTVAATVARRGIDINNAQTKIIDHAVLSVNDISKTKQVSSEQEGAVTSPLKRKQNQDMRETQGMAIRRWGVHWRSNVMFALLVDIMETREVNGVYELISHGQGEANSRRTPPNNRKLCCMAVEDQGAGAFRRSFPETNR